MTVCRYQMIQKRPKSLLNIQKHLRHDSSLSVYRAHSGSMSNFTLVVVSGYCLANLANLQHLGKSFERNRRSPRGILSHALQTHSLTASLSKYRMNDHRMPLCAVRVNCMLKHRPLGKHRLRIRVAAAWTQSGEGQKSHDFAVSQTPLSMINLK